MALAAQWIPLGLSLSFPILQGRNFSVKGCHTPTGVTQLASHLTGIPNIQSCGVCSGEHSVSSHQAHASSVLMGFHWASSEHRMRLKVIMGWWHRHNCIIRKIKSQGFRKPNPKQCFHTVLPCAGATNEKADALKKLYAEPRQRDAHGCASSLDPTFYVLFTVHLLCLCISLDRVLSCWTACLTAGAFPGPGVA